MTRNMIPGRSNVISRRRLLGGALATGAGATLLGLGGSSASAAATTDAAATTLPEPVQAALNANGAKLGTPEFGPDGFLAQYVTGFVVASTATAITVVSPNGVRTAEIVCAPGTNVFAGGLKVQGALGAVNVGDRVDVATSYGALHTRVASYVAANQQVYWGTVSAIGGSEIAIDANAFGSTPAMRIMATLTTYSKIINGLPSVGDLVYAMTHESGPIDPESRWLYYIQAFPSSAS
jgi:hypothetical protein